MTLSDQAFYTDALAEGESVAIGWNDADAHVMS
jgi:hypothetical protein